MKTNSYRVGLLGVVLLLATALPGRVHGQANRWINTADDQWEIGANWSAGVPNGTQSIFITNGVNSKTITVNNATVLSNALNSCMTVSNLIISAPSSFQNTLSLTNAGTSTEFVVRGTLTVSPRGSLTITNSILRVGVSGLGATTWTVDGTTTLNSGTIVSFASCGLFCFVVRPTVIGSTSTGVFTVAGGRWVSAPVQLGSSLSSYGTLTIAGGSVTMSAGLSGPIYALDVVNGTVWLLGGALQTSSSVSIGDAGGNGQMIVSNGTWTTSTAPSIGASGGSGTLTIAGGTAAPNQIYVGVGAGSRGAIWETGGQFTPGDLQVGLDNAGQMTISNGTFLAGTIYVGVNANSAGTFTMAGGTGSVDGWLYVSALGCSTTGIVNIVGGSLNVTNSAHTAFLELDGGTLTMSGGTLRADKIVVTNCAHFVQTGGTLICTNFMLDATNDADSDGVPNGADAVPFNPNNDSDGDGLSNLQEYLAGTSPTNSASVLRITSIATEGINIRVTWMTGPGKTNALQRTAGAAGSFSNNFAAIFTVTNTVGTITNYLDLGAATNGPAFYYRVRLVP